MKQHALSRVYQREWSVKTTAGRGIWYYPKGGTQLLKKCIKCFTTKNNQFDVPDTFGKNPRFLEEQAARIEGSYRNMLDDIRDQGRLPDKYVSVLINFVAITVARHKNMRENWTDCLDDDICRPKFINNICRILKGESPDELTQDILKEPKERRVRSILGMITQSYANRLVHATPVILAAPPLLDWHTSDFPVTLRKIATEGGSTLSESFEFYMPLDRRYCLFLSHREGIVSSNRYASLESQVVHYISRTEQEDLNQKLQEWNKVNEGVIVSKSNLADVNAQLDSHFGIDRDKSGSTANDPECICKTYRSEEKKYRQPEN